ncbi:hypothetical protein, partial [Salmonella enterica]|uniref:hypothetical protein n=1 Tax=Salmonella enterica TaxID=28901 RepID=UPI003D267125
APSAALAVAAAVVSATVGACVTPKDDLDNYLASTESTRGTSFVDAGELDVQASAPTGGFSGLYLVECWTALTTSLDSALKFAADF